ADRTALDPQQMQDHFAALNFNDPDIDAQSVVNNFDWMSGGDPIFSDPYGTGGGEYFVVVRNQEGSLGQYRVEVDVPSFPMLGATTAGNQPITDYSPNPAHPTNPTALNNQTTYLSPLTGTAALRLNYVNKFTDFVDYFPIQVPAQNNGTVTITTPASNASN